MGFCSNCGVQVPDDAKTCPACGSVLQNAQIESATEQPVNNEQQVQVEQQPVFEEPTNKQQATDSNPVISAWKNAEAKLGATKLFGVCVGIVVLLFVIIMACSENAYKSPVKKYYSALKTLNYKKALKAYDKKLFGELEVYGDEFDDYMEEVFDDMKDDDFKLLDYKMIFAYKFDKKQLEDFADDLDDELDYSKKVSDAYLVVVRYEYEENDEKDVDRDTFVVYKTRGKWFILNESMF